MKTMTTKVLGKHLRSALFTEYNNNTQKNDDCQIKEYWSIMASPLYVLQFLKICRDHFQELQEKELEEEMEGRLRVYRKLLERAQILRTELAEVCNPSCCTWLYFSTQLGHVPEYELRLEQVSGRVCKNRLENDYHQGSDLLEP